MLLAETVSIDGGTMLLILAVLMGMVVGWCTLAAFGFRFAGQAGRGDERAMARWIVTAVLQVVLPGALLPFMAIPGLVVVGLQAARYSLAKRHAESDPHE